VKDVYNKSRDSYKPPMKIPPTTPNPKGLASGIAQKRAKDNILAAKMKSEMLYAHGRVKPRINREQTTLNVSNSTNVKNLTKMLRHENSSGNLGGIFHTQDQSMGGREPVKGLMSVGTKDAKFGNYGAIRYSGNSVGGSVKGSNGVIGDKGLGLLNKYKPKK
jgi:hypothetical protein